MNNIESIEFEEPDKGYWINKVGALCGESTGIPKNTNGEREKIQVLLGDNITIDNFTHVHIVLYACLLEHLIQHNYYVELNIADEKLLGFLSNEIKLREYYLCKSPCSHVEAKDDHIFNIWRIEPQRVEEYSMSVTEYFRRNYFTGLDLSGFKSSLDESFANVCDHSQSNGIAFSYIYYDDHNQQIIVAICDLGVGIPYTLKQTGMSFSTDGEALRESVEIGITARTNEHNRGFGLDNVISNLVNKDRLRIVSNKALLLCYPHKEPIKYFELDFYFRGTLIYFEVSIDNFQEECELSNVNIG